VRFWSALSHELRALDVTTLHTLELADLPGIDVHVPVSGICSLAEVMILVRYLELRVPALPSDFRVQSAGGTLRPDDPRVHDYRQRRRRGKAIRERRNSPQRDGPRGRQERYPVARRPE
jgi:hypothetical protein